MTSDYQSGASACPYVSPCGPGECRMLNRGCSRALPVDPANSEGARGRPTTIRSLSYPPIALPAAFNAADPRDAEIATLMQKLTEDQLVIDQLGHEKEGYAEDIATLRAALDPFADCVNEGWAPDELKDDDVVMVRVKHHQGYTLKVSDFRRAAAIKQAETK